LKAPGLSAGWPQGRRKGRVGRPPGGFLKEEKGGSRREGKKPLPARSTTRERGSSFRDADRSKREGGSDRTRKLLARPASVMKEGRIIKPSSRKKAEDHPLRSSLETPTMYIDRQTNRRTGTFLWDEFSDVLIDPCLLCLAFSSLFFCSTGCCCRFHVFRGAGV